MSKIIYSPKKSNKQFFKELSSWDIDIKTAAKSLKNNKSTISKYSEDHFLILYELIKNKLLQMGHEDQVLYLEYRKKQNAILNDLRGLEFIISFFLGGTFTGIFKYSSNDIISNILLVTVTIMLALIYFLILTSHKKEFNKRLISAIENNIVNAK